MTSQKNVCVGGYVYVDRIDLEHLDHPLGQSRSCTGSLFYASKTNLDVLAVD